MSRENYQDKTSVQPADPEHSDSNQIRERLDDQLQFDPVVEIVRPADLTVNAAARFYKKSPRQIQRLLKAGALDGYKVNGPKGPEWRVLRHQRSVNRSRLEPSLNLALLEQRLDGLDEQFGRLAADFQVFRALLEGFESHIVKLNDRVTSNEHLANEVGLLKDQLSRSQSEIKELRILGDQHSMIEFIANEVRTHRQAIKDLAENLVKTPWWRR